MALRSFADGGTETFFRTGRAPRKAGWRAVARIAARKLDLIRYAVELEDLRSPPGNRLEALKGDLKGLHSIRINDQWRIVFRWRNGAAEDVRITDYH